METLNYMLNQTATNVMEGGAESAAGENGIADVAAAATAGGDPVSVWLWAAAILAAVGFLYFATKTPYPPRRLRRPSGKGPLTHFLDSVAVRISSFLS